MEKKVTRWVLSILVMSMIIAGLVSTTYALFSVDLYAPNQDVYSTGMLAITAKSKTDTISLTNALPMTDEKGVTTNPYVFTIKNIGNLAYLFDIKLLSTGDSATSFSPQYIKLKIDDGEVITLSSLINSEIKSDIVLPAGESIDISLRVWLSSDTPNSEMGKGFNSKIVTSGQAMYTENLVSKINYLYNSAQKTEIPNGNIKYNYATSVSLMNDRLGGDSSLDDGNIRYYGGDPDNYIYFNCSNYLNQSASTCETWRIIGIIDGKVKIINSQSIGKLAWDLDYNDDLNSLTYSNNWKTSSLNKLLNNSYYNGDTVGEVKYYSGSNASNVSTLNMGNMGIRNLVTKNMISLSTWYLGSKPTGYSDYAGSVYKAERTNSTSTLYGNNSFSVDANVGLLSASDYGFAADLNLCKKYLYYYGDDNTNCNETNWLFNNSNFILLNHRSNNASGVWYVTTSGHVSYMKSVYEYDSDIRPVLYLNPEIVIDSVGDGSSTNPYRIVLN